MFSVSVFNAEVLIYQYSDAPFFKHKKYAICFMCAVQIFMKKLKWLHKFFGARTG